MHGVLHDVHCVLQVLDGALHVVTRLRLEAVGAGRLEGVRKGAGEHGHAARDATRLDAARRVGLDDVVVVGQRYVMVNCRSDILGYNRKTFVVSLLR